MNYKIITSPQQKKVESFLGMFDYICPFQTISIYGSLSQTLSYRSEKIFASNSSGDVVGLLSFILKREYNVPFFSPYFSHSMIRGGPLISSKVDREKVTELLLTEYVKRVSKSCVYSRIYNLYNPEMISSLRQKGFTHDNYFDVLVNISKGKNKLWSKLAKNRRNGITKSKRLGVKVSFSENINDMKKAYSLFKYAHIKYNHPFPSYSVFDDIFFNLIKKGRSKLLIAKLDKEIISSVLLLCSNSYVYYWFGGNLPGFRKYNANELLIWEAIEWGSAKGYTIFDFGGAGNETSKIGIRKFKEQFGSFTINFGSLTLVHNPTFFRLLNFGKEFLIKSR